MESVVDGLMRELGLTEGEATTAAFDALTLAESHAPHVGVRI